MGLGIVSLLTGATPPATGDAKASDVMQAATGDLGGKAFQKLMTDAVRAMQAQKKGAEEDIAEDAVIEQALTLLQNPNLYVTVEQGEEEDAHTAEAGVTAADGTTVVAPDVVEDFLIDYDAESAQADAELLGEGHDMDALIAAYELRAAEMAASEDTPSDDGVMQITAAPVLPVEGAYTNDDVDTHDAAPEVVEMAPAPTQADDANVVADSTLPAADVVQANDTLLGGGANDVLVEAPAKEQPEQAAATPLFPGVMVERPETSKAAEGVVVIRPQGKAERASNAFELKAAEHKPVKVESAHVAAVTVQAAVAEDVAEGEHPLQGIENAIAHANEHAQPKLQRVLANAKNKTSDKDVPAADAAVNAAAPAEVDAETTVAIAPVSAGEESANTGAATDSLPTQAVAGTPAPETSEEANRPQVAASNAKPESKPEALASQKPEQSAPQQENKPAAAPSFADHLEQAAQNDNTQPAQANTAMNSNNATHTANTTHTQAAHTPQQPHAPQSTAQSANSSHSWQAASHTPAREQVSVMIHRAVKDGMDKVTLQLDPVELGRVEVRMDVTDSGRTHVVFNVENRDTLELLQRDARFLERALQDAGLSADAGQMEFNLSQSNQFANQQRDDGFDGAFPDYQEAAATEPDVSPAVATTRYSVSVDSGVDIKV